jgi:hypothetical protein
MGNTFPLQPAAGGGVDAVEGVSVMEERLRQWSDLSSEQFYHAAKVAILPLGYAIRAGRAAAAMRLLARSARDSGGAGCLGPCRSCG